MEFDIKPDFYKAKYEANIILLSSNYVDTFPFEIVKLIKEKSNIVCTTYLNARQKCPELQCKNLGSDDAVLTEYKGKRLILINKEKYGTRVRFSVGHEFGHHTLKHDLSVTDKKVKDKYEVEANMFAAQLLMPEEIIIELIQRGKTVSKENIMKWFNVSETAANKRLEHFMKRTYNKMTPEEQDIYNQLLLKYKSFINNIAPINYYDDEEELQKERDSWLNDRRTIY